MARQRVIAQQIRRLTLGCCDSIVDAILFECYTWFVFQRGHPTMWRALRAPLQATYLLDAFDAKTIRRAIYRIKERGVITTARNAFHEMWLTRAGRRWLEERFPTYHAERPWDGRMFLVTYDLPERRRYQRAQLREYLRRIRCAPLQASVWVTPYNPRTLLRDFVKQHRIPGVIVSSFERGSAIGEISFRDLVASAYDLLYLNDRYTRFLREYRGRRNIHPRETTAAYLQILADDPQLPFVLLPEWWRGDEAHALVSRRWRRIRHDAVHDDRGSSHHKKVTAA